MLNRAAVKKFMDLTKLGGASLFLLAVAPVKALPVFDNWTVANGAVNVTCPSGFTCETLTTGDGFAQVQWVDTANGDTYIQTIITDTGAGAAGGTSSSGLPYSDESFVMLGGSNGISSRQHYIQDDTDTNGTLFENTAQLNTGWAQVNPTDPDMTVTQSLTVDADLVGGGSDTFAGNNFSSLFDMQLIHDTAGTATGSSIAISQDSGLGSTGDANSEDDIQKFRIVHLQGDYVTGAGNITLDPSSATATDGGAVSWNAGDDVMIRWIGQSINLGAQGTAVFGYEGIVKYANGSNSATIEDEATTFSTASTGIKVDTTAPIDPEGYDTPFDWDTAFGATSPTVP
jgi:hypothetical protein